MESEQVICQNRERFIEESRNQSQSSGFCGSSSSSSDSYNYRSDKNGDEKRAKKTENVTFYLQASTTSKTSDPSSLDTSGCANDGTSSKGSSTPPKNDEYDAEAIDNYNESRGSQMFDSDVYREYKICSVYQKRYQNYDGMLPLDIQTDTQADNDRATQTTEFGPLVTTPTYASVADYLSCTDPTLEWYKFRCQCPIEFVNSVAQHLWFISFTPADMEILQTNLALENDLTSRTLVGSRARVDPKCGKCRPSLCALMRPTPSQKNEKELNHWYVVVNTMLNYLLEGKRYKFRSILLRPGNVANMNRLEKDLFPPNQDTHPLLLILRKAKYPRQATQMHYPALATEVIDALHRHTTYDIACLLIRILRPHGMCLIPEHLRPMFLQLFTQTGCTVEQRRVRATGVLFQLMPKRAIRLVMHPLLELLTKVTCEPVCDINEAKLAIIFAPVLFLDRHLTTPAELMNPILINAAKCLFLMARSEMLQRHSVIGLFQILTQFHEECIEQFMRKLTLNDNDWITDGKENIQLERWREKSPS